MQIYLKPTNLFQKRKSFLKMYIVPITYLSIGNISCVILHLFLHDVFFLKYSLGKKDYTNLTI